MITVLQYPGKKNSIAQWIIGHFPNDYQSMTYLEPFFGSGSIFFRKERSTIETINDLDSDISNLFMQIRDKPSELVYLLEHTPWSKDEYNLSFEKSNSPLEQARRCIVRFWFAFGANVTEQYGMRFEIVRNSGALTRFHVKLPEMIVRAAELLKHCKNNIVQIENRSVFELLPVYNCENVLMYLDPPYLPETRTKRKLYNHEFTVAEHEELLRLITVSKANIIISGYMNNLYNDYLSGWRMEQTTAHDQVNNKKTECIWMNYESNQAELFTAVAA